MGRKLVLVTDNNPKSQKRLSKKQRFFRRALTLTAIVGIFVLLGYTSYSDRLEKLKEDEKQLAKYEQEYASLVAQEEYYRAEISKLENEDYIARLAREKYFKSEEGEIIFKLPEDTEDSNKN
ncbi:MAG: FtsB family cell division protein [Turicibacter sp.]